MIAGYPGQEKGETRTACITQKGEYLKKYTYLTVSRARNAFSLGWRKHKVQLPRYAHDVHTTIEKNCRFLRSVTFGCALSLFLFAGLHSVLAAGEEQVYAGGTIVTLQKNFSDEAIFINGALLWSRQERGSSGQKPARIAYGTEQHTPHASPSKQLTAASLRTIVSKLPQVHLGNDVGQRDNKRMELAIQTRWGLRQHHQGQNPPFVARIHRLLLKAEQEPEAQA